MLQPEMELPLSEAAAAVQRDHLVAGKGKREALNRVIERRESDDNVPDSWKGICQQIQTQRKVRTAGHRNHREQETKYSAPIGSEVHQECREDGVDEIELRN